MTDAVGAVKCIRRGCIRGRWRRGVWCYWHVHAGCCTNPKHRGRCVHRLGAAALPRGRKP